jgi:hypothetical protein
VEARLHASLTSYVGYRPLAAVSNIRLFEGRVVPRGAIN